jgi:2,5-diamino-6-(ribosylamino)-4(3H)-pyrimidinone 5'-phosphate reductase
MSIDGKIASPSGKQVKISSDEDIKRMYLLRNKADAVLVGINTVLSDNPRLTVKEKYVKNPKQPIRIVLDTYCRTPKNSLIVNNKSKTYIISAKKCEKKYKDNVEIVECKSKKKYIDLRDFLEKIYERGIKTLMVEGGSTVIWSFLSEKLVDDIYIYVGSMIIGGKNTPRLIKGNGTKIKTKLIENKRIGSGILLHYKLIK